METTDNNATTPKKSDCNRVVYVILALFLGTIGIHNLYARRIGTAIAQFLITIFTGWLIVPLLAVWIWNIVEMCAVTTDGKGLEFS